jgi:EpsD family peptidyl-prolyl cis-trans isomerase
MTLEVAARLARTATVRGLTVLCTVAALTACGDSAKKDKPASQVAAKVNKEELSVHQINLVLQQQRGLRPEQADAASRQILERLIDQEVALQKAEELRVDRDPRVMQQIEAARREIIARAYAEKVGEAATRPSDEEVSRYYSEKPALFKARRVYSFQELNVEAKPEQLPSLKAKLDAAKSINDFVEYLKANDFRFAANQTVRAAEQLPLSNLDTLARMKDGEAIFTPTPGGAQVLMLAASRSQPVDEQRARPAIEQFLLNERKRQLIEDDLKSLRKAAKIEYVGKFAESSVAPAAAAPAAPTPPQSIERPASAVSTPTAAPAAPQPAASMLDIKSIDSGIGLKK